MRVGPIDNNSVIPNQKVGNLTPGDRRPQTRPVEDQVSLSREMQLVQTLTEAFAQVPEVRHRYVEAVKQKLASPEYQVDSEQLAERIVQQLTLLEDTGNFRAAA